MNGKNTVLCANENDVPLTYIDELTECSVHKHNFYEFAVTANNGFYHTVNGLDVYPSPGDVLMLRPEDSHSLTKKEPDAPHTCINIMIPTPLFDEVCESLSKSLTSRIRSMAPPVIFHVSEQTVNSLLGRFSNPLYMVGEHMLSGDRLNLYRQIRRCLAYEIAGYLITDESFSSVTFSPCITAVLEALENEDNLCKSISRIAEDIGYSPSYLSRQFRKQFSLTLEQYMISQKLAKSKSMLVNTDISIEQIGCIYGWNKPGSFIRAFKNAYGISPGKYRRDSKKPKR